MAVQNRSSLITSFTSGIPAEVQSTILAHIVGQQAELHRYADPTEKLGISVGPYISDTPTSYSWPGKLTTSIVDLGYVAVFIDNALLRYFQKLEGAGETIAPVSSYKNRIIISGSDGFKASPGFSRLSGLFDRDVKVGDVVHLNHTTTDFYSTVTDFVPDVVASGIDAATADSNNTSSQSGSSSHTQTSGTTNDVDITTVDISAYNGLPTGDVSDTYVFTCTTGSTGADATTARFSVTTASGRDNVTSLTPAAFGFATTVGTRGLKVTWSNTSDDLAIGQKWTVVVHQVFTAPTATKGGTFAGTTSCTYIITVTLGGHYADSTKPQITVTNDIGTDSSGPTNITAAASDVAVGTQSVLVQFNQTALNKGDKYYIVCHAPSDGALRTLVLNNNMPAALLALSDMTLELSIEKNIQVPQDRISSPPTLNWTDDQSGVSVNSDIDGYDPTLTDTGTPFPVPVVSGPTTALFVQYRAWMDEWLDLVGTVTPDPTKDPTPLVESVLGAVSPYNPLAYAVYKAALNSNLQPISFSAVQEDTLTEWTAAAVAIEGLPIWRIVPLSNDVDVLRVFKASADAQSTSSVGHYRTVMGCVQSNASIPIVDQALTSNGQIALATVSDDPNMGGTQYTLVTCTTDNARFVTNAVAEGDVLRYQYTTDAFGNSTYSSYVIASVVNEDTLILNVPGTGTAVGTAQKMEVWRSLKKTGVANDLVSQIAPLADKRVCVVWPDLIDADEGMVNGYFLAAAVAGLTSTVAPHQGLLGAPILGFTGASRSVNYFNNGQLDVLAAGGFFVVTQDASGNVFPRNTLTTDQSSVENSYEVVERNDDAISAVLHNRAAQFSDIANLTSSALISIQTEVTAGISMLQSNTFIQLLGNMITSGNVVSVAASAVTAGALNIVVSIDRPFPIEQLVLVIQFNSANV